MSGKKVKLWYDRDGDILEVFWDNAEGYFSATEDDRVMANVDMAGQVQGFLIEGVSKITASPLEVDLVSVAPEVGPDKSKRLTNRNPRKKPESSRSQED